MRQWAKLFAVVGIVELLGCAANVVATVEPEPADEPELHDAIVPEPAQHIDAEQLRRPDVEQALDEHPGYWRCAYLSARMHRWAMYTVPVRMTLVNDESGEAAKLVLDPMPGHATLRACLLEALSSMRFAPTSSPVHVRRAIVFQPSDEAEMAAKLTALTPEGLAEEPGESSCPTDIDERCEAVSFDAIIGNALYVPETPAEDIEAARGTNVPDVLDVRLHFCVDQNGRTKRIRRSQPGPGQPVVDRLIATVSKWRVRPFELANKPILACSHVDFSIAFVPPVEAVEAVMPPLTVVPAQAVYSPVPHWKTFRSVKPAFRLIWVQRGQWRYRAERWWGFNTTAFCIGTDGRVRDIRTVRRFPGSPKVDAILRETIKQWRFKPLVLGGQPRELCTERTFRIEFELQ